MRGHIANYEDEQEMTTFLDDYDTRIAPLEGWLSRTTAFLTMHLLGSQLKDEIRGNMFEIGVMGGRYLALMAHYLRDDEKATGIDPFYIKGTSKESVERSLADLGLSARTNIVKDLSGNYTPTQYLEKWGPFRFFHIDGSHQRDLVLEDLKLADEVISDDGLVAFDDFFNVYWIGVTEALFAYFHRGGAARLVPVGYCRGKLFLAREKRETYYRELFTSFASQHPQYLQLDGAPDRVSKILDREIPVLH